MMGFKDFQCAPVMLSGLSLENFLSQQCFFKYHALLTIAQGG